MRTIRRFVLLALAAGALLAGSSPAHALRDPFVTCVRDCSPVPELPELPPLP